VKKQISDKTEDENKINETSERNMTKCRLKVYTVIAVIAVMLAAHNQICH
jgi:hypothetical protein